MDPSDLLSKINQLQNELDDKTSKLLTVQRNFESLSLLVRTLKTENLDLKSKYQNVDEEMAD
jgi:chromosome segregation ATPase